MSKNLIFVEYFFTLLSLLFYSGGPLVVVLSGGASEGELLGVQPNNTVIQIIFLAIYILTFLLLIARWKKVFHALSKDKYIVALLLFSVMSVLWSDSPGMTIQRSFSLTGTSLFGIYLATRYSLKQQLQMLSITFSIAIFLSIVFILFLPKYGIMGGFHSGSWRGIYTHKNGLGSIMSQSAMLFLILAVDAKKKKWLLWLGLTFSIILLFFSKSSSPLINFAIILVILPIYWSLRWQYELIIPTLLGFTIAYGSLWTYFTSNADNLLKVIGKDATLTGRTNLWPFVWDMVEKRPWLGYGYNAFWVGWDGASAYVWRAVGWEAPNAHNGFLDLLLDLGIVGMLICLLGFVSTLLKSLSWARTGKTVYAIWPLLYLTYLVLANFTENTLLERNSLPWVLYVALALSVLETPVKQMALDSKLVGDEIL